MTQSERLRQADARVCVAVRLRAWLPLVGKMQKTKGQPEEQQRAAVCVVVVAVVAVLLLPKQGPVCLSKRSHPHSVRLCQLSLVLACVLTERAQTKRHG